MATPSDSVRLGYRPALDGIRGIAVLLVVWFHASLNFGGPVGALQRRWVQGGWAGVELFFVLSGFLITTLLLEEWDRRGDVSLGAFYRRRAMRLLPALAVLLLVALAYTQLVEQPRGAQLNGVVSAALYQADWADVQKVDLAALGHTWTLSVEGQFYLLWPPVLLLLVDRLRPSRVMLATLGLALAFAADRAVVWLRTGELLRTVHGLDAQADTLLLGALIGMAFHWRLLDRAPRLAGALRYAFVPAFALFMVASWLAVPENLFWVIGVLGLCSALMVLAAVELPVAGARRLLVQRDLVWLGQISYSLYLWHVPVMRLIPPGTVPEELLVLVRVALSFALALLSYHLVERPVSRLRHRPTNEKIDEMPRLARAENVRTA